MSDEYDRTTQDVGNILGLEHVNLLQNDRDLADRFWVSTLGFTRDAYIDLGLFGNMWVNLGGQQFHLPAGDPQCFRGRIGLAVADLDLVAKRLTRLLDTFPAAGAAGVAWERVGSTLEVTAPFGSKLVLHAAEDLEWFGTVGMPYVEVDIERGKAPGVVAFYEQMLGAPSQLCESGATPAARVGVGRRQHLRFVETDEPLPDYDGHHIAVYLHDFSGPYGRLRERGLISMETDDHEYRFIDIVDPDSGDVCAQLEHEVRSMFHPMFGRELVNRDDRQGLGTRYRQGHDARPGLHLSGIG